MRRFEWALLLCAAALLARIETVEGKVDNPAETRASVAPFEIAIPWPTSPYDELSPGRLGLGKNARFLSDVVLPEADLIIDGCRLGSQGEYFGGKVLEVPGRSLVKVGMNDDDTIKALGYPHGGKQLSERGGGWRYMFTNRVLWIVFQDGRVSAINSTPIESGHKYFYGMIR